MDINPADVVDLTPHRGTWHEGCTRVGAIGVKLGASVMWNQDGFRHPVTLIQVGLISSVSSDHSSGIEDKKVLHSLFLSARGNIIKPLKSADYFATYPQRCFKLYSNSEKSLYDFL